MNVRTMISTPHINPGKKPAIMARGGKPLHSVLGRAVALLLAEVVIAVLAPVEVPVEVVEAELLRTHWFVFALQL